MGGLVLFTPETSNIEFQEKHILFHHKCRIYSFAKTFQYLRVNFIRGGKA